MKSLVIVILLLILLMIWILMTKKKLVVMDENVNLAMGQLGVQVPPSLMLQCCWWTW